MFVYTSPVIAHEIVDSTMNNQPGNPNHNVIVYTDSVGTDSTLMNIIPDTITDTGMVVNNSNLINDTHKISQ